MVSANRSPRLKYRESERPPSPMVVLPTVETFPDPRDLAVIAYRSRQRTPQNSEPRRRAWSREVGSTVTPSDSASRPFISRAPSGVLGGNVYQYKQLEPSEFRLVEIRPARMATVKCLIKHFSVDEPPSYVAISYAWGDAGDTRNIQVQGASIGISVSLYGALEALRQKTVAVLVWVDALCIDQQNQDERTQQVQLMAHIYTKAKSIAIWLGPEADDSSLAIDFLIAMADKYSFPDEVSSLISVVVGRRGLDAVVLLFEREYWRRLWVVQEVFNAKDITVYCGSRQVNWSVFKLASSAFARHRDDLEYHFTGTSSGNRQSSRIISRDHFTHSQVLIYQGPRSLPDISWVAKLGEESLLAVLRACRRKLASEPRDKVFGILGLLPQEIREEFPPDYSRSLKDVYIDVVDYLLFTTECLDVICEAIHFPVHTDSANLPTFVPDWSHIPQAAALGDLFDFSASGTTKARFKFDERRTKLQISAIYLDTIRDHGITVGTLCTLSDYVMAFLHWRALLLGSLDTEDDEYSLRVQEAFCVTLCLGKVPAAWDNRALWMRACYLVFATLIRERLPHLPLDRELERCLDTQVGIKPGDHRSFLQEHFASRIMGRCFCLTEEGLIGMGSGFMRRGDVVVVPLGCSTPVLLRPEGDRGEYRFVGDVYIYAYMQGKAVDQWNDGGRKLREYVLH
jgi:hypothetical protein